MWPTSLTMNHNKIFKEPFHPTRYIKKFIYYNAIILMYHRVTELKYDPWSMAVKPKHFAEHMDIISKHGNPISLQKLRKNLQDNKPILKSIVVTFDDGYADNLINAKPILERYNIPTTVFVATQYIDQKRQFWWDELGRLLMQTVNLPGSLHLNIRGKKYKWELEVPMHSSNFYLQSSGYRGILRILKRALYKRKSLYHKIYRQLRYLPTQELDQVLKEIRLQTNAESNNQYNHLPLSSKDLCSFEKGGIIEIGAHTESHPHLSKIPLNSQRDEIQKSKAYLENILGHNVNSFAYPHGSYSKDTIPLVKEAGFNCACSSIFGRVKRNNNLYLLPRVAIKDWDGEAFYRYFSKIAW